MNSNKYKSDNTCQSSVMNSISKKNNKRALVIHFTLSVIGFFSFILLVVLLENTLIGNAYTGVISSYVAIVLGSIIYLYCGFRFLNPSGQNLLLSVLWLSVMCLIAGVVGSVGSFISLYSTGIHLDLVDTAGFIGTTSMLVFNTIGLGASAAISNFSYQYLFAFPLLMILFAALPPALIYLGLRLRNWQQGQQQGETDELAIANNSSTLESRVCSS